MWEYEILGVSFYHICNWFYIYSFLGWVWESSYISVKHKKLVNRGFVTGPVCTIYGCGAVIIYVLLRSFENNVFLLYIGGVVLATGLEFVTATIMEGIFHTSWWDYSKHRFNYKGRICLSVSLAWGGLTILLFKVLHPVVTYAVDLYPASAGETAVIIATILYIIDFINSTIASLKLSQKLVSMDSVLEEIQQYIQNSKLYESGEELVAKIGQYRDSLPKYQIKEKLEQQKTVILERIEELGLTDRKQEIESKMIEYNKRYAKLRNKLDFVSKRYMNAYPKLDNLSKINREKKKLKKKKKEDGEI